MVMVKLHNFFSVLFKFLMMKFFLMKSKIIHTFSEESVARFYLPSQVYGDQL